MSTTPDALGREIAARIDDVHAMTEDFFTPDARRRSGAEVPEIKGADAVMARWHTYPAFRSERAQTLFEELRPELLARLAKAGRPEEALGAFDGFLKGLPAGVQVFSLFRANPQLIDLVIDIVVTAPALGQHLARNAQVFDAVIGGDFFQEFPDLADLKDDLSAVLARETDYEAVLDAARRWGKEWHFRAGVHLLRGISTPEETGTRYAWLAEATLRGLFPFVCDEFAGKHGPPPGRGAVVLGMGSLGAGRLHARSDLDVIVIYDADGVETSQGRKPLAARAYYARLTQALVTAMTAPMAEGRIYEMDMRLRPSGQQGPVATSLTAFRTYQTEDAWLWEHLALTRARPVAGADALAAAVEAFRVDLVSRARQAEEVTEGLREMRARIRTAKGPSGPWELKVGRGRMQEIELMAQAGALLSGQALRETAAGLEAGAAAGWLSPAEAETLTETHALLWSVQMGARLLGDGPIVPAELGAPAHALLTRLGGAADIAGLEARIAEATARAGDAVDRVLGEESAS